MRHGRAAAIGAFGLALVLVAGACSSGGSDGASGGSGSTDTTSATGPASDTSWLFVQTAAGGTWVAGADGTSGTLSLTGVSPEVQAFTDRPARQVAWESPQQFTDAWASRGFEQDPPNASVALHTAKAGELPVVVELTSPTWDAGSSTLTYKGSVVGGTAGTPALPASFGEVSLFVDSGSDGTNLGMVQVWATLASDTDSVTITLDDGMALGSLFQFGTITQYCNFAQQGQATGECTAAWQVNGHSMTLSGSRATYAGSVPAPFVTTKAVTFGTVMVPGSTLTGTAKLSSGATLSLVGPNNTPVPVSNGSFSVDVALG